MNEPTEHDPDSHADDEARPVCLRCFTPYKPLQHYCETCGETVGQMTPYIPFVNIPFNVSIFSTMWKRTWSDPDTPLRWRAIFVGMFILFAPLLLLGLPFVLIAKLRPPDGDTNTGDCS